MVLLPDSVEYKSHAGVSGVLVSSTVMQVRTIYRSPTGVSGALVSSTGMQVQDYLQKSYQWMACLCAYLLWCSNRTIYSAQTALETSPTP